MQISNVNNEQSGIIYGVSSEEKIAVDKKERAKEPAEKLYGKDEYIPSEKDEPIGLYAVSQDDEGNPKIDYDEPKGSEENGKKADGKPENSEDSKKSDKKKSESCTGNTDKVDREIERLKKRLKELSQRVNSAEGRERERIEKQIKSVESELAQKDNDTYRRQHTVFS